MARFKEIYWWLAFIILAIYLQALSPGLDVLAVGLIILLQEKNYRSMLWLLPLFCLIQEGTGTSPFGISIIWYGAIIFLFIAGQWLFEARNFIFVFLLSACLGVTYFVVAWLAAILLNTPFNMAATLDQSLIQALFMPLAWCLLSFWRPRPEAQEQEP